ncbi:hypothetical protein GTY65_19815 [Streptomyces sp. SID8379]|uniref:hypothetical protein n=1 Tax=unclassified Streptomyces TaxID=2593676 RepID=UPI00037C4E05|nr:MULTISPECIES: hypothetical protein [unclassified Streptomyces]MYW66282.1 hypothetical protein [Streptomyces sp. SID8379]
MFWLAIALGLTGWAAGYAVLCWVKPFAPCRKCEGIGKVQRRGKLRMCSRCHDAKLRLRVGRRAHNAWRRTRADGMRLTPDRFGADH